MKNQGNNRKNWKKSLRSGEKSTDQKKAPDIRSKQDKSQKHKSFKDYQVWKSEAGRFMKKEMSNLRKRGNQWC